MTLEITPLRTSWMGESAILCDTLNQNLDLALQERFWSLAERLSLHPFVREVVPGMNNLLVLIDPLLVEGEEILNEIRAVWRNLDRRTVVGREIDIPVRYGGAEGVDLAYVANFAGLTAHEYVRRHSEGRYMVFALGSQPGFGYLAGLDPLLAVPRREVPRVMVHCGSVVIGGAQTGVISRNSPSGWHIIGVTDIAFFDPSAAPPALLAPGDTIRFHVESLQS